jgi:SAM-dependent methyltransferase
VSRVLPSVHPDVVRRTVAYRLPPGSLVVDVAWQPDSPLRSFADRHPTLAIIADGRDLGHAPAVRGEVLCLPLADASVDCVLVLHPAVGSDDGLGALTEAKRVLRPGGLAVVSATGRPDARDARVPRRREAAARLTAQLGDLGLVPEQVHRLQPLLHPTSLVGRVHEWARRARPPGPFPRLRRTRVSSTLVLGRKV